MCHVRPIYPTHCGHHYLSLVVSCTPTSTLLTCPSQKFTLTGLPRTIPSGLCPRCDLDSDGCDLNLVKFYKPKNITKQQDGRKGSANANQRKRASWKSSGSKSKARSEGKFKNGATSSVKGAASSAANSVASVNSRTSQKMASRVRQKWNIWRESEDAKRDPQYQPAANTSGQPQQLEQQPEAQIEIADHGNKPSKEERKLGHRLSNTLRSTRDKCKRSLRKKENNRKKMKKLVIASTAAATVVVNDAVVAIIRAADVDLELQSKIAPGHHASGAEINTGDGSRNTHPSNPVLALERDECSSNIPQDDEQSRIEEDAIPLQTDLAKQIEVNGTASSVVITLATGNISPASSVESLDSVPITPSMDAFYTPSIYDSMHSLHHQHHRHPFYDTTSNNDANIEAQTPRSELNRGPYDGHVSGSTYGWKHGWFPNHKHSTVIGNPPQAHPHPTSSTVAAAAAASARRRDIIKCALKGVVGGVRTIAVRGKGLMMATDGSPQVEFVLPDSASGTVPRRFRAEGEMSLVWSYGS